MATANSTRTGKGEAQLLRRAFDTFYEFDAVNAAKEAEVRLRRVKRRTRWIAVTIVAASVLVTILMVFAKAGVNEAQEQRLPTIEERLAAPYELGLQPVNLSIQAGMPNLDGLTYNNMQYEAINPPLRCMLSPANCTLSFGNIPVVQPMVDHAETDPALVEAAQAAVEAAAQAALDTSTELDEYGNPIPAVFEKDLMVFADMTGMIAGHYTSEEVEAQVLMAQFTESGEARSALLSMFDYARSIGTIGNYAMGVSQPVSYFYSSAGGWVNFVWVDSDYVYSVSTRSWRDLGDVIAKLQALPPVPVMDNLNAS